MGIGLVVVFLAFFLSWQAVLMVTHMHLACKMFDKLPERAEVII
jgi:hypothetical protein